jgi:hypothetical protein
MKYHGGTNFGRTAGGPFITTSYDYDAPIDEYGKFRLFVDMCIAISVSTKCTDILLLSKYCTYTF